MTNFEYYVLFVLVIVSISNATYTPVVQTKSGPVRGIAEKSVRHQVDYSAFIGIPYAEPPVGLLRFKPPVKKKSWTDVYDVVEDGNVCTQYLKQNESVIGSEDCLYLNVYTPHLKFKDIKINNLKAVMVWIHGGGFVEGYSLSTYYAPDFLIEDDVILVTLNYRLGAFGFLNLDHDNATGNAGLKDQNLALKWVNENIKNFGGDPNRITIFGQSAGGASVDYHVLSEMSSGLFHRSIAMSGSALCLYWASESRSEAVKHAFTLAAKLGANTSCKDEVLRTLYKASASDIILKTREINVVPFRPSIENVNVAKDEEKFISKCAVDKFSAGEFKKAPHILGFTSLEAEAILHSIDTSNNVIQGVASLPNLTSITDNPLMQPLINQSDLSSLSNETVKDILQYFSDVTFVLGIDTKQRLMQHHNDHPIYYYQFSFEDTPYYGAPPSNISVTGVGHLEDLPYLFYIASGGMPLDDPVVQNTVDRCVRLFTNFAKYGNPTPNSIADPVLGITWPDSGKLGIHLEIDKKLSIGKRPINKNVEENESNGIGTSRRLNGCI